MTKFNIGKWLGVGCLYIMAACQPTPEKNTLANTDLIFRKAETQTMLMAEHLLKQDTLLPRSFEDGEITTSSSRWWTSGFFPGTLWLVYEQTRNPKTLEMARNYTERVRREQFTTNNHDIGFMLYCSFGNGLRITKDSTYIPVLLQGAESLSTRFNPKVGLIRSWDDFTDKWQYPVIIDNMMNLELLYWASKVSGNKKYADIATQHAEKTMKEHFRKNYSCYHVVSYDTISGQPEAKQTNQGCADESSWARGQAWALYGYTMVYRETQDKRFLHHAEQVADFLINHSTMPQDGIPYWDFDAPDIPNVPRDASSAAIMASGLLELSQYVSEKEKADQYFKFAEKQLSTLCSPQYTAEIGENGFFILKHSVGNMPIDSEIDAPLTYADYYYLEALSRYKKLTEKTEP